MLQTTHRLFRLFFPSFFFNCIILHHLRATSWLPYLYLHKFKSLSRCQRDQFDSDSNFSCVLCEKYTFKKKWKQKESDIMWPQINRAATFDMMLIWWTSCGTIISPQSCSPPIHQHVDQEGHCSKAINLTPPRPANNSLNGNKMTFPFSSVVMLKTITLKWPLPHIICYTVCCVVKRRAGDPSVPHMAPLSW